MAGLPDSLADADDQPAQRREWRAERVGWAALALLLLVGSLGLLGSSGPLSERSASGDGVSARFSRMVRHEGPTDLRLRLDPPAAEVWLGRSYLEHGSVERVVPPPSSTRTDGERCVFVFSEPVDEVCFAMRFECYRPLDGRAGTGERSVSFRQWMLP
jgi:hypothetical protein